MKYTVGLSTEIPVVCPFSVTNQRHLITRFFNCCKYQYYGYNYCFYYHLLPTTSDGTFFIVFCKYQSNDTKINDTKMF